MNMKTYNLEGMEISKDDLKMLFPKKKEFIDGLSDDEMYMLADRVAGYLASEFSVLLKIIFEETFLEDD